MLKENKEDVKKQLIVLNNEKSEGYRWECRFLLTKQGFKIINNKMHLSCHLKEINPNSNDALQWIQEHESN